MGYDYITFRSVTYAQRGERVLSAGGIRTSLQRTPRWMEEQGCGYCLRVRSSEDAVQLLRRASVPFRKVYTRDGEGKLVEVAL